MESYTATSGARIHVDPDEEAGSNVLARGGPKARERALWSFLADEFSYDTVLDLGANYGQVTLEATYPDEARIILVEANPGLLPYLERSVATHPNRDQIAIRSLALGGHAGVATFFVRRDAVGKSSMIRERGDAIEVPLGTVDALVASSPVLTDAIIKLDVEGSELALLEGAAQTLSRLDNYAIMVELHPGFMRSTAGSVGGYLELLCGYGYLWERKKTGFIKPFDLSRFVQRGQLDDILIVSGTRYTERIRDYNQALRQERSRPTSGPRSASGPSTPSRPGVSSRTGTRIRAIVPARLRRWIRRRQRALLSGG